jgi:hypothetical protein
VVVGQAARHPRLQDWDLNVATDTWRKFDPARNLAAGKPATASSETGANVAGNVTAPKTYQNYINTHWDSAASEAQWLMVDLGQPTDVNRVVLKWNTNAAKEFTIQTSLDNTSWTDVFHTALGSSYFVTDETNAVNPHARLARFSPSCILWESRFS